MNTLLEIEFKILLTASLYEQILKDYHSCIDKQYTQTNYYLMHPVLDTYKYMLRIREKEGNFELTLKEPVVDGNLETNVPLTAQEAEDILNNKIVNNAIFNTLHKISIDSKDLDTSHSLCTIRTDIIHPVGILSIDKNRYEGITDYELEFEVTDKIKGKEVFSQFLDKYHLTYEKNCPSKIKRLKQML